MLNDLVLRADCAILTREGCTFEGMYEGVETVHGDWAVLVLVDDVTHSIPVGRINEASRIGG